MTCPICDICTKPIENAHPIQKRHRGECHREFMRRYAQMIYYGGKPKKPRLERKSPEIVKSVVTCPNCHKTHIVEGRADRAARVYCEACTPLLDEYGYAEGA